MTAYANYMSSMTSRWVSAVTDSVWEISWWGLRVHRNYPICRRSGSWQRSTHFSMSSTREDDPNCPLTGWRSQITTWRLTVLSDYPNCERTGWVDRQKQLSIDSSGTYSYINDYHNWGLGVWKGVTDWPLTTWVQRNDHLRVQESRRLPKVGMNRLRAQE